MTSPLLPGSTSPGGADGGFPWVQAATAAIGAIGDRKAAKNEVARIRAETAQQLDAARAATADFGIATDAAQAQRVLAEERNALAIRAEQEALRQARLVENVDVSVGETGALAAEARTRRRRFFQQETV